MDPNPAPTSFLTSIPAPAPSLNPCPTYVANPESDPLSTRILTVNLNQAELHGWLWKERQATRGGLLKHGFKAAGVRWRRRYFHIRHACLCYDSAKGDSNGPIGVKIPLRFVTWVALVAGCVFRVDLTQGRDNAEADPPPSSLRLRADSETEANFWVARLLWLANLSLERPATIEEITLLSLSQEIEGVERRATAVVPPSMWGRVPSAFRTTDSTTQLLESTRAETRPLEQHSRSDGREDVGDGEKDVTSVILPLAEAPLAQRQAPIDAGMVMTQGGMRSIRWADASDQLQLQPETRLCAMANSAYEYWQQRPTSRPPKTRGGVHFI